MPGREVRRNERDASHGKTPSTSLKGVAGRSVKSRKNPEENKNGGSRSRSSTGTPNERMRRRATLPHPLECSTIAVPGLSFRVRKGTGRLTWAMTTAKPIRYGRPEKPAAGNGTSHDSGRGGPGTGQRTRAINALPIIIVTTRNSVPCHPTRKPPQDETQSPRGIGKSVPRSPVSTGRLHPSRDFHLRPIEHVFNMRATNAPRSVKES